MSFSTGNIIFWAGCESVAFFGMVAAMVNGSAWPTFVLVIIAMALQAITFPLASSLSPQPQSTTRVIGITKNSNNITKTTGYFLQ